MLFWFKVGGAAESYQQIYKHSAQTLSAYTVSSGWFKISGALVLALLHVPPVFHLARPPRSLVLYMGCVYQTPPPAVASIWTGSDFSCRVARANSFFAWPEPAASVQSLCPCSSALSRWRRGAAGPLLGPTFWAGGWGSGACRRPPDPPAPSDPQAFTDTRPSFVSPARNP